MSMSRAASPVIEARAKRIKAVPKRYQDDPAADQPETKRSTTVKTKPLSREQPQQQLWIACDECFKWRRVTKLPKAKCWTCKSNPDTQYSKCSVPQELSDAEVADEVSFCVSVSFLSN